MVNKFNINKTVSTDGWSPKIYNDEYKISKIKVNDNCCCYRLYYLTEWLNGVKTLNDIVVNDENNELTYRQDVEDLNPKIVSENLLKFKNYIESVNFVHGDLNFGNVLVTKQNEIKLIDFENSYYIDNVYNINNEIRYDSLKMKEQYEKLYKLINKFNK